eukprot:190746_1
MSKKRRLSIQNDILPSKKQKLHDEIPSQQPTEPMILILNVGGIKFETSKLTLSCDTNSILYKMFDPQFAQQPNKDGSYFIDRDGTNFGYILNYLRNNKLNIPNDICLINHLILESEYYQLSSLRSSLLVKKSNSKILQKGDIEFIHQCFDQDPKFSAVNIQKSALIYEGPAFPDYSKLKGLYGLLVLVFSKDDRFGIYIDDNYFYGNGQGVDGKLLDFHSGISGQQCVHQQHKGGDPQNAWIFIDNLNEMDPGAECDHEVELQVVIPAEDNVEDWQVLLEIGGTTTCTGYRGVNTETKLVSHIEIYQIGL